MTVHAQKRTMATLIPGDGVGSEITEVVKKVFKALAVPVDWDEISTSTSLGTRKDAQTLLAECTASLRRNKIGLKGVFSTSKLPGDPESLNVRLRRELGLHSSVTPIYNIAGIKSRYEGLDMHIIRENIEGEYTGLEHRAGQDTAESLKVVTYHQTKRHAEFAFEWAVDHGRRDVTCVHKANILKKTDGLFLDVFNQVASDHPELRSHDMIIDNACMQAVLRPAQFDIVVLPNLYACVFSNIMAAHVGGAGVVPSGNYGQDVVLFEPACRHAGTDIEGKNVANPTAMLLSACMMLDRADLASYAQRIRAAIDQAYKVGDVLTPDLGGQSTTEEFGFAVIAHLKCKVSYNSNRWDIHLPGTPI